MKITSQVKINTQEIRQSKIKYTDLMDIIRSDIAMNFTKELLKTPGLISNKTNKFENETFLLFELKAIVITPKTFKKIGEFLKDKINPDEKEELRKIFTDEL